MFANVRTFCNLWKLRQEKIEVGGCYAFVISEDAKETYPLWKDEQNYIVNNEGKTFSNLTY